MNARPTFRLPRVVRCLQTVIVACVSVCAACSQPPPPRSFDFFFEDSIARDGALARCNQNPDAALRDIECSNARRAATAIQLQEERSRRELLERESEQKLEALRQQFAAQQLAAREAEAAAIAAARAAYEAQWRDEGAADPLIEGAAAAPAAAPEVAPAAAPVEPAQESRTSSIPRPFQEAAAAGED